MLAALALPGTALAQSAGDDQYQDPLAGQGGGGGGGGGGSSNGTTDTTGSAPSAAAPSSTAAPTQADPQASTAAATSGQLPRTGFDVILTVEIGLALLLTGVVAQRMLVLRERHERR